ncbi:helix-turn-helix domain-containing protein [Mycolicibacterium farcinogenes]|nr:helix-turn-helix domain-containing protein [Mycolicibacterium farcinogenes]
MTVVRKAPETDQPSDTRWMELVDQVTAHRERLVDAYMAQIDEGRRFYESRVDTADLRESARMAFTMLLRQLAGAPISEEDRRVTRELGVRRARQGVQSRKLTAAIHRDFSVLWSAFLELSEDDDATVLTHHTEDMWRVVDGFAGSIHAAYFDEVIAIAQERSFSVQSLLAQLMTDEYPSLTFIARAGQALSIRETDGVWVAAALVTEGAPLQQFAERLRRRGRLAYTYVMGECILAVWVAGAATSGLVGVLDGFTSCPDRTDLQSVRCGVSPLYRGIAQLRSAAEVACEIALSMHPDHAGPTTIADVWPLIAGAAVHTRLPALDESIRGPLRACRPAELTALLETIKVFSQNGDASATAAQLFCHRNTVMKRLRRFKELTGLDMTVPADSARVLVVLASELAAVGAHPE